MTDGRAYLLWREGPLAGSKVPIDRDYFIIGRDPDYCHLVIEVDIISRQHAALKTDEHRAATLIDLFSRSGTYLDGKHVTQHALKDGARISLGRDGSIAFTYYGCWQAVCERGKQTGRTVYHSGAEWANSG